jgi:hypothetical protein
MMDPMAEDSPAFTQPPAIGAHALAALPAVLAWLFLIILLGVNVPAMLRMGLDSDVSVYDLYVRDILQGRAPYRDTCEVNFPGMLWAQLTARWLFGWSSEAIRAVDLLVVGASVWLLVRWVPAAAPAGSRPALAAVLMGSTVRRRSGATRNETHGCCYRPSPLWRCVAGSLEGLPRARPGR